MYYHFRPMYRMILVLLLALTVNSHSAQGKSLNEQLQIHAPQIIRYLHEHDYHNVGVLKFRIKKGRSATSDRVGTLNKLAADRLAVALTLANPHDRAIGIIRDANIEAMTIDGASHLHAAGRAKLFQREYALAWGEKKVRPDGFVTGVIQVAPDLKTLTVGILAFGREGGALEKAAPVFEATTDASVLGEIGESFLLRGAFDDGATQLGFEESQEKKQDLAVKHAGKVQAKESTFPLKDAQVPVTLSAYYDGSPVSIQYRGGQAFLPEPNENQDIRFAISHADGSNNRYAVVVKVNGENTIYRQTQPDLECSKWILGPGKSTKILGYQLPSNKAEKFRVLSMLESEARAMDYGHQVGQIGVTVYRELPDNQRPDLDLLDEQAEDLAALTRGVMPSKTPANLSALKHQLRTSGKDRGTRGLIVQGEETDFKVRTVPFRTDPTPVMSATITYYKP